VALRGQQQNSEYSGRDTLSLFPKQAQQAVPAQQPTAQQ
jgi:hypothetical protein